jgi:Mrp family chromosome partitioning ATPase
MSNQGGGDEVTVQRLQNEVDRLNIEYQTLVARSQSAQDVNVAPDINFKQTLIGQPAIKPEPGKRKMIIILSTLASFIVSTLSILILDFLDNSLRTPTIFKRNVKLPLLASLNKLNLENRSLTDILNTSKNNTTPVSKSEEVFIENIRKLRFELESRNKKIILFTSTKAQQGKTTIIQALSSSLSLTNKKVLLVDTNFANNTLTETYNAKPVLDTYSASTDKNVLDKFWNITNKTNIPNTDIVGCNKGQFTPNEILPKNNLLTQLDVLKSEYDYIFLEGADLNTHADSKELSIFADGLIVVFSANSTIGQLDKESIQFIKQNENKLIGAILNQVDLENLEL